MRDKDKQFEEIASDICPFYKDYGSCERCNKELDTDGEPCYFMYMAMHIIRCGYRKLGECENIGTVHPVDEFKCSVCGITLEGWTRVVTDEDDGELYYYEYEFRYCPNCGARMKGGE